MGFFSPTYISAAVSNFTVDEEEYEDDDPKIAAANSGQAPPMQQALTQQMIDSLKQVLQSITDLHRENAFREPALLCGMTCFINSKNSILRYRIVMLLTKIGTTTELSKAA